MNMRFEPFAVMLHRRHCEGESVEQLAHAFDIPKDRIVQRLRAAAVYCERQTTLNGLAALNSELGRTDRR